MSDQVEEEEVNPIIKNNFTLLLDKGINENGILMKRWSSTMDLIAIVGKDSDRSINIHRLNYQKIITINPFNQLTEKEEKKIISTICWRADGITSLLEEIPLLIQKY